MHLAKLVSCKERDTVVVNVRITDEAWAKCNQHLQQGVENILRSEPVQLLSTGGHGNGIKWEGSHWVFHTQTGQRLATSSCSRSDLQLSGMTFDRVYNH